MQQRRVRLGDILDDYCPRERRITNHAVVAMIEDEVKQTRCTTCDADHEYKHAKVPPPRRKKVEAPPVVTGTPESMYARADDVVPETPVLDEDVDAPIEETPADILDAPTPIETTEAGLEPAAPDDSGEDEWPVHRPLIRATLPRPDGQAPERKAPDFTIRQNGGRFDGQRNGNRHRGHRPAQGQSSGHSRFGSSRQGSGHGRSGSGHGQSGQGQRHGNRPGPSGGQRGGSRPGGQRGQGRGPKRGR
jgi:translation initiation factor IF-2